MKRTRCLKFAGPKPRLRLLVWLFALVAGFSPLAVAAHARWFVPGEAPPPDWSEIISLPVALAAVAAVATVAALALLEDRIGDPLWPRPPFLQRMEPAAPAILGVMTAITLIFEATRLNLFAPPIELPHTAIGVVIAGAAIVAAFTFVTGVLTRIGALMVVGLWFVAFAVSPWYEALEQVLFVGIAIFMAAVGRGVVLYGQDRDEDETSFTDRLLPISLPVLRIATGVSILMAAFTEKLVNLELGEAFLREYPNFNVPGELLGIAWFTDERFVYIIGIIEAMAGVALITGYLPRLVILLLWLPFNLGIPFLPPQEMIGHLPILAAMYVLLVRGTEGVPAPSTSLEPSPAQRPASRAAPAQPPLAGAPQRSRS